MKMTKKKRFYWLKLKENFFAQPKIKKLRRIAGGDTYTIIYLKMQLLSLGDEGKLCFEGIEDDFIEEIALTIDEDVENVRLTVMFLMKHGLIEEIEKDTFALIEAMQNIGSESAGAERVRRHREKQNEQKALQCNAPVTKCNTEIEIEKDIELDKELEIEKDNHVPSVNADEPSSTLFLTLRDSSQFPITNQDISKYQGVYTKIDVIKEIKKAILWCDSNPSNRKTKTGAKKFINGWLNRAESRKEEKAIEPTSQPKKKSNTYTLSSGVETSNPFIAMLERGEIVDE